MGGGGIREGRRALFLVFSLFSADQLFCRVCGDTTLESPLTGFLTEAWIMRGEEATRKPLSVVQPVCPIEPFGACSTSIWDLLHDGKGYSPTPNCLPTPPALRVEGFETHNLR
uniref:Secreted protein n=1 Tax=Eutreptiella gymnastica TaxID=73025 RepID=A0A7S1NCF0_9EUGL